MGNASAAFGIVSVRQNGTGMSVSGNTVWAMWLVSPPEFGCDIFCCTAKLESANEWILCLAPSV